MSVAEAAAYAASRRRVFIIAGHGGERPGSFPLSGACDVIVKKSTCEEAYRDDFNMAMDGLLSLPEETVLYPTQHMNEIIKRLGSMMVYSRHLPRINGIDHGSCINLHYDLMMMHFREDEYSKYVQIYYDTGSGIIDYARWKAARTYVGPSRSVIARQRLPGMGPTEFHNTAENIQLIGGLYEHSVFPTMGMIEAYLRVKWKDREEVDLYDMLDDLRKQPYLVKTTQEFLCKHFAGVYYHMVCRSMAQNVGSNITEYETQWQTWKRGNAAVNVKKMASNPLFARRYFTESARRRHYFNRYYHSQAFQEREHTTNMANCRNLEARMTSMEGLLEAVNQQHSTNEVKQKERANIQRKIRLLRTIRNDKHMRCVHRNTAARAAREAAARAAAEAAAEAAEAADPSRNRRATASASAAVARNRSRSPRTNGNQTRKRHPRKKGD